MNKKNESLVAYMNALRLGKITPKSKFVDNEFSV